MEKSGSVTKKPKQLTSPVPPPPLPPLPDKPAGDLVAKSPPESSTPTKVGTLQSSSEETPRRDTDTVRVLQYGGLQMVCGVLMLVLGVLTLVHKASMGQWGAGLWGGGAAATTGLAGLMAGLRGYYNPGESLSSTGVTVYLALCLVSLATTTLAIVVTSTGLLRDLHRPVLDEDVDLTAWAPVLTSLGLLLASVLLAASLVAASLRVYRRVCPCTRPPPHRLLESPPLGKQGLVHSWLGLPPQGTLPPVLYPAAPPQPLLVYPPPLMMEGSGLYTVPPSSVGYPQCISPLPNNPYMQRRRSPHPHRGRHSVTPDSTKRSRRPEKREKEKREITDEQLEKTYTGLDREIAEEFISIAMTNSQNSSSRGLRPNRDKVIDCIAPR
ncbi:uncharacterized protein LOC129001222 [Macrosteles quadrilineatus]|uniref:uncharacterized protein LOC129001222 n=1 Tax=Macrosteles quadrilineatus TaxID=74068 RepID=UPI0023E1EDDE|nr:uncharacterized protein LOC129001222 [Macrosteles quadrilineatus]